MEPYENLANAIILQEEYEDFVHELASEQATSI